MFRVVSLTSALLLTALSFPDASRAYESTPQTDAGAPAPVEGALPPRSAWRASSSAPTAVAMQPSMSIDGDVTTKWGGSFAAEQWLQLDLSAEADLGGIVLHWDSGFAASYRILTSANGREWQTVYETIDGQGGIDYVFFRTVRARYVRLASLPLSADWGVSVLEIEPLAQAESPQMTGFGKDVPAEEVWNGNAVTPRALARSGVVTIALPRPLATTGLEVQWGEAWREARLEARDERGRMRLLSSDRAPPGDDNSLLAAREPVTATMLRLTVSEVRGTTPAIRRLRLLPADRKMTPLRRYEVAASRAHRELFPLSLRNKQIYWTTVGIPAGRQKSIFDEFGNLEAWKGAPMVQPLFRAADGTTYAAHNASTKHTLREGWMPLPAVQWSPKEGLTVRSEALTVEQSGQPVTILRHRLQNGSKVAMDGDLFVLVRPHQVNPSWQGGGSTPIREIALEGTPEATLVRVDGRPLAYSVSPITAAGAAPFGARGEEELTTAVVSGVLPTATRARDDDGLAAAYLRYTVHLEPGQQGDVVLAFPLGNDAIDVHAGKLPLAPAVDVDALRRGAPSEGEAFDARASEVAQQWRERIGRVGLSLPDRSLVDMLRAQVAYMLINQTGPAMQPGPRNYNRSFIRDGAATSHILLRMGLPDKARDYLEWYAEHAVHDNGLVSPILNQDGSVNRGFGSDLEFDSQGQFVALVADVARLDGGPDTVRKYLPEVKRALRFLKQLRERTMVAGYLASREAPERFHGIVPPSISHEGYPTPTHSYWDDFWALKGLADAAWLATALGQSDLQALAETQYQALRESMIASMKATMAWKRIDTVPSSADLGEYDPTSTSIGLDPCGQRDLLPTDALTNTYDRYIDSVRKRDVPHSLWAYTPYELRNVLTYVHLDRLKDGTDLLDQIMRHRRPVGWQVLAEVVHSRLRHAGYLGDMPHTWVGAEYVRAIFGMLMRDENTQLDLLPGTPTEWLAGDGVSLTDLRTAFGKLTMSARQDGTQLTVELGPGLAPNTPIFVTWPWRLRPERVTVDGQPHDDQTEHGIRLSRPFKSMVVRW